MNKYVMQLPQWQSDFMRLSLAEVLCWESGERFNTDQERTSQVVQVHVSNQGCGLELEV